MTGYWYLFLDLALCGLAAATVLWAWPRLDRPWRRSALWTAGTVMLLQCVNEYLSLHVFRAWTFSFEHNHLVGLDVLGVPVEEMLFWFAFAWFIPFAYSGLAALFRPAASSPAEGQP